MNFLLVPMDVTSATQNKGANGRDGKPTWTIHGYVGDYGITLHMTDTEYRLARTASAA